MKPNKILSILASSLLLAGSAKAADFDFSGTFTKDNDVVSILFNLSGPSTATFFTSSWVAGGFDPIVTIWDSSGLKVFEQDDGNNTGSTFSNSVSYNHGDWDSHFFLNLAVGSYRATITQFSNFANSDNFADGFQYDGDDDFASPPGSPPFTNGSTGNWAFHILNVDDARQVAPTNSVPDSASTLGLMGLAMMVLLGAQRRLQRKA